MKSHRKYLNYTTPWGVDLTHVARSGLSAFLIHESGYQPALDDWNHTGVDSPFWRFYHNPKAGCFLRHQEREIQLDPSVCVLIPADTVFDCCGPVSACHLWMHFTVSRTRGRAPEGPQVIEMNEVLRLLSQTVIHTHQQPQSDARDYQILHQSAAILHAAFALLQPREMPAIPDRIMEVLALIHRAPDGDLSNPTLAARSQLSTERFIRKFREHTGQTPSVYVTGTRIRLAQEALALTDRTIDQIAVSCGFPNRHYFSRVFAKQIGCGPAEFRLRQRERKGI
jgi:AraC family transcriptional regulator, arabinose operon regulatory protein